MNLPWIWPSKSEMGQQTKEKKREGGKKRKQTTMSPSCSPDLWIKSEHFWKLTHMGSTCFFCGDEHLGPKMQNKALRGVMGHWGVSSGDCILVHFWGHCGQHVLWAQTDGFGVSTQFLCIYGDTTRAFQTHPVTQELQHQTNFSALACLQLCRGSHT